MNFRISLAVLFVLVSKKKEKVLYTVAIIEIICISIMKKIYFFGLK